MMLVGFAEGLGAAKTYAAREHQQIDANRELLGLGTANLAAVILGCWTSPATAALVAQPQTRRPSGDADPWQAPRWPRAGSRRRALRRDRRGQVRPRPGELTPSPGSRGNGHSAVVDQASKDALSSRRSIPCRRDAWPDPAREARVGGRLVSCSPTPGPRGATSAQTRCVAGAPGIPVAIAEQVSTADDGVAGLRLKRKSRARRCYGDKGDTRREAASGLVCLPPAPRHRRSLAEIQLLEARFVREFRARHDGRLPFMPAAQWMKAGFC